MNLLDRNVTIDPQASATPVDEPQIIEVIDLVSGAILQTKDFITSLRYDQIIQTRLRIRENLKQASPLYSCPLCSTPVYLVANPKKRFFFRHTVEDGSCPALTREPLSEAEIRRRKYHGLRESEAHKGIKGLIERSLRADPTFAETSILQERRWKSAADPSRWRKPDVQAIIGAQRFAFEAQLSTTFLDVVVERRLFYKNEGAHLVWVMAHFDPDYRRMTTDDLLFSNNSNILVVDDETTKFSEEKRAFHIRCFYRQPFEDGDKIGERWNQFLAPFAELTLDAIGQRAYWFDFEAEEQKLYQSTDAKLRAIFFEFWKIMQPHFDGRPENVVRWKELQRRLSGRGIVVPDNPDSDRDFRPMIHSILSAIRGQPVGWQFQRLIQVAHHLVMDYPRHLLPFALAIEIANRKSLLLEQDISGKWVQKRKLIWQHIVTREPDFMPDERWLPVLSFLFPELGERVTQFLTKAN